MYIFQFENIVIDFIIANILIGKLNSVSIETCAWLGYDKTFSKMCENGIIVLINNKCDAATVVLNKRIKLPAHAENTFYR